MTEAHSKSVAQPRPSPPDFLLLPSVLRGMVAFSDSRRYRFTCGLSGCVEVLRILLQGRDLVETLTAVSPRYRFSAEQALIAVAGVTHAEDASDQPTDNSSFEQDDELDDNQEFSLIEAFALTHAIFRCVRALLRIDAPFIDDNEEAFESVLHEIGVGGDDRDRLLSSFRRLCDAESRLDEWRDLDEPTAAPDPEAVMTAFERLRPARRDAYQDVLSVLLTGAADLSGVSRGDSLIRELESLDLTTNTMKAFTAAYAAASRLFSTESVAAFKGKAATEAMKAVRTFVKAADPDDPLIQLLRCLSAFTQVFLGRDAKKLWIALDQIFMDDTQKDVIQFVSDILADPYRSEYPSVDENEGDDVDREENRVMADILINRLSTNLDFDQLSAFSVMLTGASEVLAEVVARDAIRDAYLENGRFSESAFADFKKTERFFAMTDLRLRRQYGLPLETIRRMTGATSLSFVKGGINHWPPHFFEIVPEAVLSLEGPASERIFRHFETVYTLISALEGMPEEFRRTACSGGIISGLFLEHAAHGLLVIADRMIEIRKAMKEAPSVPRSSTEAAAVSRRR